MLWQDRRDMGRAYPRRAALLALSLVLAATHHAPRGQAQPRVDGASVLQHHRTAARDGHYVDAAFTRASAARLRRDAGVHAVLHGPTYAQPLYWAAAAPGEKDLVLVATEQNEVSALDASTGALVWRRLLGPPVPRRHLACGNIDPLGITGTPIIDPASRTIFVDAMTTPDAGTTKRHVVAALSLDDGSMRPGWPVDVARASAPGVRFDAAVQNQRGALALLDGTLYVPYGGHFGDCGNYHGWVIGIPTANPGALGAWATRGRGGGIWAPGGIATVRGALYATTGNTFDVSRWSDGEAILRLRPGPTFSARSDDFFAPANWRELDSGDIDLGGSGPLPVEVANSTPARLLLALGKDGVAYLVDEARMGGIGRALVQARVADDAIITAAATYTTPRGTYVAFKGRAAGCAAARRGSLTAIRIAPGAPPTISVAWCADQHGLGSPIVTTSDGRSDAVVWSVGAEGDNRLRGFDGDTGRVVFDGGGAVEAMSHVRRYQTPIVAKGRIFVAGDDELYAFRPD
jgi:outer membrane protein assembly factor BamB